MSKKTVPPIDNIVNLYVNYLVANITSDVKNENVELEAKFATRGFRKISYVDFNNVIKKLLSMGFKKGDKQEILRIFNETIPGAQDYKKLSNIRTELLGMGNISEYCKTNKINNNMNPIFERKHPVIVSQEKVMPVNVPDFNFRVSLQKEMLFSQDHEEIIAILDKWTNTKKTFRYISRNTFTHDSYPFKIDLSIVKNSKTRGRQYVPEFNFIDSGTLDSVEHYEIEIEIDNDKVLSTLDDLAATKSDYTKEQLHQFISLELLRDLKKNIKFILCGLQETNYPVSYKEQGRVMQDYLRILWKEAYKENMRAYPKNFIGPSQYTLQMQNVIPPDENINIPNIRNNYTVTEKADGSRKLLFSDNKGKLYFITTNMDVQFTGCQTTKKSIFNTIIDGEHILHNKKKEFINLYAAFDIYYINNEDVRALPFIEMADSKTNRLQLLTSVIKELNDNTKSVVNSNPSPLNMIVKTFYSGGLGTIFGGCNTIITKEREGNYEYETDGLIFTPSFLGVGSDSIGKTTKPIKTTWDYSFKWKPAEYNTIDFLVEIEKGDDGKDSVGYKFQSGTNTKKVEQITEYKTVILRVGFDENKHGYINPCKNMIDGDFPDTKDRDDNNTYKPMRFFPTNPSDNNAGKCNIMLHKTSSNDKVMKTEENEIIENNMIVEFKYVKDNEDLWKWVPLRVRYDKTADLRNTGRNFGNAYHVANSNWHSIHNPITTEMITTGRGIPETLVNDEVYYNVKMGESLTRGLRDFHNLYVKKMLIANMSKPGDTLIDLAVGKAGDINKWYAAKLKFVFGIDLSRDNLENRNDGACRRYLDFRKKFSRDSKSLFRALFVNGNSSSNIRDTAGIYSDKGKQITKAIFGNIAKNKTELGEGVYDVYGIGKDGFDICSIQFAIHYMFESQETLQNLLRNVSETTKIGGYFIGTCYDGSKIFDMLSDKKQGESETIYIGDKKIWSVTKEYNRVEFTDDESSLGYAINVYQETINKTFREYLVNFKYFTRLMENYGFVPITPKEAKQMNMPMGVGSFKEMFNSLSNVVARYPNKKSLFKQALDMNTQEKKISFLNNFFIYKKVRDVDAANISRNALGITGSEEKALEEESKEESIEATEIQTQAEQTQAEQTQAEQTQAPPEEEDIVITKKSKVNKPKKSKTRKKKVKIDIEE